MRWTYVVVVLSLLLVAGLVPAVAQMGRPQMEPPPEEPMGRMMKMMGDMEGQMQRMHGEMRGMQGMGPMQDRVGRMMGMMGEMRTMMEQHRQQMQKQCPGSQSPSGPKSGG